MDQEMAQETENFGSLGVAVSEAVTEGVTGALREAFQFRIEAVRDLRYEDGRLRFLFEDPSEELPEMKTGGQPVTAQFAPDEARRFVERFRARKQGR